MTTHPTKPAVITNAGELLSRYDVIFCDVWGVLHNGFTAYVPACDALSRFRAKGGIVILVSNAPVPKDRVASMLDSRKVSRDAWDDIVSSGDIALRHVAEQGYKRLYCIGPFDRDEALFAPLGPARSRMEDADAVLCSGLNDDRTQTAEDYRDTLAAALAQKLPFVCANPDLVVDVGGQLYYCAGAIADLYKTMGGEVFWAGKPHAVAYETAQRIAEDCYGAPLDRSKILVIGDSLRTDMAGAAGYGVDALFIASGIHRDELINDGTITSAKLEGLFATDPDKAKTAIAAMLELTW